MSGRRRPAVRIQTRLVATTTLVLAVFLAVTGLIVDRSVTQRALSDAEEQLLQVVFSLMSAAETEDGRVVMAELPEPRLRQTESGLYAAISELGRAPLWRSPSALTTAVEFPEINVPVGESLFVRDNAAERFLLAYAVIWEDADETLLIFQVAADQARYLTPVRSFRQSLYAGLSLIPLLVLVAQIIAIRWGLKPLRIMAEEVRELEEGGREQLSGAYPPELQGLADNLGRFVAHEHRSRARYRNALEDLAHSLKTPLAVMRNALGNSIRPGGAPVSAEEPALLGEQLDRMENAVNRQLSRAAVAGPPIVAKRVDLEQVLRRLGRALQTAHQEQGIALELRLAQDLSARGDERDFMDLFGNVLENAFKYTRSRVLVTATAAARPVVCVEDDGPGIDPEIRSRVVDRGIRADRAQPGQGIGLAVVAELTALYSGSLVIGTSRLGGASVTVTL